MRNTNLSIDIRQYQVVGTEIKRRLDTRFESWRRSGTGAGRRHGGEIGDKGDRLQTRPSLASPDLHLLVVVRARHSEFPELHAKTTGRKLMTCSELDIIRS